MDKKKKEFQYGVSVGNMKIGRNQPCICGSNIKSKRCIPTHQRHPHELFDDLCDDVIKELGMENGETRRLPVHDTKFRQMNTSKGYISLMSRYISKSNKYYIELNQVWISKKYRGMGLGTEWIETIIKISNKYNTEIFLQVSDLDYLEEIYYPNKMNSLLYSSQNGIDRWNEQFGYSEEFVNNHVDETIEWVKNYEDIKDNSQREFLHIINNQRLIEYYTKLGFQPYFQDNGEYFMIYSNKTSNPSIQK